jgi:tetratricopeptide (TPR) repeat protein
VSRRWCLPPAIIREPGEVLEGSYILDEFGSDLALVLWTAVRDVTLWSSTPAARRAVLFSPGTEAVPRQGMAAAGLDPALDLALATLATVVSHPAQANPEVISLVCLEVARWAREQGRMGTAVAFAQAAAFAHPNAAVPALAVGELAVEWGRYRRAETWLRRAIGLARRAGDWESYGSAYVALGEVYVGTGRAALAPRYFLQAARLSRRQGNRAVRAQALHGLLRTSLAAGDLDAAEAYARGAQRAYGRAHPRLPHLQHDVAQLLVARGHHARAVPMLRRQLGVFTDPARRALCHALLAHCAAALADSAPYEHSWAEAWALLDAAESAPVAGDVLRHLGKAAERQEDWLRVQLVVEQVDTLSAEPLTVHLPQGAPRQQTRTSPNTDSPREGHG